MTVIKVSVDDAARACDISQNCRQTATLINASSRRGQVTLLRERTRHRRSTNSNYIVRQVVAIFNANFVRMFND